MVDVLVQTVKTLLILKMYDFMVNEIKEEIVGSKKLEVIKLQIIILMIVGVFL